MAGNATGIAESRTTRAKGRTLTRLKPLRAEAMKAMIMRETVMTSSQRTTLAITDLDVQFWLSQLNQLCCASEVGFGTR